VKEKLAELNKKSLQANEATADKVENIQSYV